MAPTVIVSWYTTGFRGDGFGAALNEVAARALGYGANSYAVYRSRDDRYKFQQLASFDEHIDWERYWGGPEMIDFRVRHAGWYQVPVAYSWWDLTAGLALVKESATAGDGRRAGNGARILEGNGA